MGTAVAQQTTLDHKKSRIMEIAVEAFGDLGKANQWMYEPNLQLGNRPPIEQIATTHGFNAVETVLYQIQYAVIG